MKAYEITLKMGVVRVREDEISELMGTLASLEPGSVIKPSKGRNKQGFLDYEAARAILAPKFDDNQKALTRNFTRLWLTISRLASRGEIAYDAECRFCGNLLDGHGPRSPRCVVAENKARMIVSAQSLRDHAREFMGELPPVYRIGPGMREDYTYLVEHLPTN